MADKKKVKKKIKEKYFHPAKGTTIREIQLETARLSENNWIDFMKQNFIMG